MSVASSQLHGSLAVAPGLTTTGANVGAGGVIAICIRVRSGTEMNATGEYIRLCLRVSSPPPLAAVTFRPCRRLLRRVSITVVVVSSFCRNRRLASLSLSPRRRVGVLGTAESNLHCAWLWLFSCQRRCRWGPCHLHQGTFQPASAVVSAGYWHPSAVPQDSGEVIGPWCSVRVICLLYAASPPMWPHGH